MLLALPWLVLAVPVAAAPSPGGGRTAPVIGNSGYLSVGRLPNPGNDAKLMARSLLASGFKPIGGDALLDVNKPRFDRAIAEFGRTIAGAHVALFYFSGHGLQVDGTNFLVPVDANPTRLQDLDFQMVSGRTPEPFEAHWKLGGHATFMIGGRSYDTLVFDVAEANLHTTAGGRGRVWYAGAWAICAQGWRLLGADNFDGWSELSVSADGDLTTATQP